MSVPFSIENAILCEHLVPGLNNKQTLINLYAGNILVKEFPAQIPIAIYIELKPKIFGTIPLDLKLYVGRKEAMAGVAEAKFEEGKLAVVAIPTGLILFEKTTTLKITLSSGKEKPVTVIQKQVLLNPDLVG